MSVLRLSVGGVFFRHRSCVADHGPGIRVVTWYFWRLWNAAYFLINCSFDMSVLRLSVGGVSFWHRSCVAGHEPGIRVVIEIKSIPVCSVFWIGMRYTGISGLNETELIILGCNEKKRRLHAVNLFSSKLLIWSSKF
jgi:hypothetical protein